MYKPVEKFMRTAIKEAISCTKFGEHPVGAVIVQNDKIICKSGNRTHRDMDPTQHAEMVVIRKASQLLKKKDLSDCILYTTHEPCPMCSSAIIYARLKGVVFGTKLQDILEFGTTNINQSKWKWRSIAISLLSIIEKGDNKEIFVIGEFMCKECKLLFDLLKL